MPQPAPAASTSVARSVTEVLHPLVQHKLGLLRDVTTTTQMFRQLVNELTLLLTYEATKGLADEAVEIETPLEHMLSAFFVLAETTGDVADAGKAIALALGIGLGALGAGVGIGNIFGSMIQAVARQPELRGELQGIQWLGFALTEAVVFYGLIGGLLAYVLI